jgi:hypothetical protein
VRISGRWACQRPEGSLADRLRTAEPVQAGSGTAWRVEDGLPDTAADGRAARPGRPPLEGDLVEVVVEMVTAHRLMRGAVESWGSRGGRWRAMLLTAQGIDPSRTAQLSTRHSRPATADGSGRTASPTGRDVPEWAVRRHPGRSARRAAPETPRFGPRSVIATETPVCTTVQASDSATVLPHLE